MKDLNLYELLKDCPKGMKLYTTVWGEVEFVKLCDVGMIIVLPTSNPYNTNDTKCLYSDGRFTIDGECIIFPSKENRDWSKFHRPFVDGDILTNERGSIFIYKGPMYYNKLLADFYCGFRISDGAFVPKLFKDKHFGDVSECRFATEEEKQKLFDAIKSNGYKWNAETKTLEKLIAPWTIKNAKAGDVIWYDDGWTCIFKNIHGIWFSSYCFITDDGEFHTGYERHAVDTTINGNARPATKEQCDRLFQKIKEAGYKWNPETKTLEKINPKFKVGDKVESIFNKNQYIITELTDAHYVLVEVNNKFRYVEPIIEDENWKLVPQFNQ